MPFTLIYSTKNYKKSETMQTYSCNKKNTHILKQLLVQGNKLEVDENGYRYTPSFAYKKFAKKFKK
jgi:hypothetical protein